MKKIYLISTSALFLSFAACTAPLKVGNLNIYQPSTLRLQKDIPIQTLDGVYKPQLDEIWHSDKRYRILEREIYNAK